MRPDLQAPQTWSGARDRSEIDHAALAFSGDFLPVRGLHPQHHHSRHASAAIEHWFVRVFAWHEQLAVPALLLYTAAQSVNQSGLAPGGSIGSVCKGRADVSCSHAVQLALPRRTGG
jgi:hypothetical protein